MGVPTAIGHCLNVAISRSGGFFRILLGEAPLFQKSINSFSAETDQ